MENETSEKNTYTLGSMGPLNISFLVELRYYKIHVNNYSEFISTSTCTNQP